MSCENKIQTMYVFQTAVRKTATKEQQMFS